MRTFEFAVKGVTYENRQEKIAKLTGKEPVRIVPEPENPFDANALSVIVAYDGDLMHIGYMPKERAAEFAPYLDGENVDGEIVQITGGFKKRDGSTASLGIVARFELPELPVESV